MAYNLERTEQIRKRFARVPDVHEKKMFGSVGFIVNGKLCIGVGDHADHVMMVRIGLEAYQAALKRDGVLPAIMRGREMKGYVFLLESAVEADKDLDYWVEAALKFNETLGQ